MEVIYIILPLAIVLAVGALAAFFWAVHKGQFDDLDTARYRILFDDDQESPSEKKMVATEITEDTEKTREKIP